MTLPCDNRRMPFAPLQNDTFLRALLRQENLGPLTFLDLNTDLVERELRRRRENPRSGPTAENLLRDLDRIAES